MLKAQSGGLSTKPIYIVFAADWCGACDNLYRLLQDAGIENSVVFVDIERTWGFLFSREMGVNGVPTLAVINSNKTIQTRAGVNKIITYLVARLDKNKDVELIQGL